VPAREMRTHPIGTGAFKFVEFKPNELIRVTKNPDYWKSDRLYLDAIEYPIVPSISTRILGFVAGKFDSVTGVSLPLMTDIKVQLPDATCTVTPTNLPRTLLINRSVPPFDPDCVADRAPAGPRTVSGRPSSICVRLCA
jgi:peptide/nickel transport system substrate-binding protein